MSRHRREMRYRPAGMAAPATYVKVSMKALRRGSVEACEADKCRITETLSSSAKLFGAGVARMTEKRNVVETLAA